LLAGLCVLLLVDCHGNPQSLADKHSSSPHHHQPHQPTTPIHPPQIEPFLDHAITRHYLSDAGVPDQSGKIIAEYVWIGGSGADLRSKVRRGLIIGGGRREGEGRGKRSSRARRRDGPQPPLAKQPLSGWLLAVQPPSPFPPPSPLHPSPPTITTLK